MVDHYQQVPEVRVDLVQQDLLPLLETMVSLIVEEVAAEAVLLVVLLVRQVLVVQE